MRENPYESPKCASPPESRSVGSWSLDKRVNVWILAATLLNLLAAWYFVTFVPRMKPFGFVILFVAVEALILMTAAVAKSICRYVSDRL